VHLRSFVVLCCVVFAWERIAVALLLLLCCRVSVLGIRRRKMGVLQRQNFTKTSATQVDTIGSDAGESQRPPSIYGVK
jgi:hypothetical protein